MRSLLTERMSELAVVPAPRIPVTSTYHGIEVTEDYRWLADASAEETIAWTEAQPTRKRPLPRRLHAPSMAAVRTWLPANGWTTKCGKLHGTKGEQR